MFPALLSILFAIVVYTILGFLVAAVVSFVGVPIYFRIRKNTLKHRFGILKKIILTVVLGILFSVSLTAFAFISLYLDSGDYWKDRGFADSWRVPLEYPYALGMIDVVDNGYIYNDDSTENHRFDQPVNSIKQIHKEGHLIFGMTGPTWYDSLMEPTWFLFDCVSGISIEYKTEVGFRNAIDSLGIDDPPNLITVEEYYYNYWDDH